MSKKVYPLLFCILLWFAGCSDAITPAATIAPTDSAATVIPTAQPVEIPTDSEAVTLEPPQTPTVTSERRRYEDDTLNFSLLHVSTLTVEHENGTTRIINGDREMVIGVRDYMDLNGRYSAEHLAKQIVPPPLQNTLTLTETTIGENIVYQTNADLWLVKAEGRYLGIESEDEALVEMLLEGFSADATDFQDNYNVISSEIWIAELRGGANISGTFTVQRRDGTAGYTIRDIPHVDGLGYTTYEPLFFQDDALYYISYEVGDGGGCGGPLIEHVPTRFDLRDGSETQANFSGSNYSLAPDGKTLAYVQSRDDETLLTLHDLEMDVKEMFPIQFGEGQGLFGKPIFSEDMSRIALATQRQGCGELGLSVETIDLSNREKLTYFWSEDRTLQGAQPTAWRGDILTLSRFDQPDRYLNIWTGEVSRTAPQPVMERTVHEAQEQLETNLRSRSMNALYGLIADEFVIGDLHGKRQTVERGTAFQMLKEQSSFRAFTISRPRNALIAELLGDLSPDEALGREQQETTLMYSSGWNFDHRLGAFLFIEQNGELAEWTGILFMSVGNDPSAFKEVSDEVIFPSPDEQWQAISRRYEPLPLPDGEVSEQRYSLTLTDGTNTQTLVDEITVLGQGVRYIGLIGWSADSRYFHYVPHSTFPDGCAGLSSYHPELLQIEVSTGVIRSLFDEPVWDIQPIVDGQTMLAIPSGDAINHILYRGAEGAAVQQIALPDGDHQINAATELLVSPDGKRVVIVAYHDWCFITADKVTLFEFDMESQAIRPIITLDKRALDVQGWANETTLTMKQLPDECPFLVDVISAEMTESECE